MRHDWDEFYELLARKRRCRNCGAVQTHDNIQSWGRIVGYTWYPKAGRCKGTKRR